ncbi:siroheme synthase [Grosmannia clavigera kw1407]|uniref:Siroheme synthase n=1 Tax=Grosmannia clavigera (strain kw1407 / UAMH 11150) TaxID=655863 RepID=F0XJ99_GROCL|nr:siroheme synthase [Grosmannia clavigera kw1407]EFX02262.1 siroheme synthase [Grosmannia clavigera kw1407]
MAYHTSFLTAVDSRAHVHLIVGANPLAATRCGQSFAVGAIPVLVAPVPGKSVFPAALQRHIDAGSVPWVRAPFQDEQLFTLGRADVGHVVDAVFVTEDAPTSSDQTLAGHIAGLCRRHRIPVNVTDQPRLCSFALLSTYTDGPLQIGVTTNGSGCRLAARIRREVAASLPAGLGDACARLGLLRRQIQAEDRGEVVAAAVPAAPGVTNAADTDDTPDQSATFNRLVSETDVDASRTRRMRWLAQMCEYWPLKRLAGVSAADVDALLQAYSETVSDDRTVDGTAPATSASTGTIILAGSGPGHPDLLTRAVHQAILSADLVLADKLVPQGVLDLIPRHTEVSIARKFPGNAEAAQDELVAAAVAGARAGRVVLRLKQGDPFVYGRGGEEVLRLRAAGFADASIVVLPGVTSALSAPLFASIPPTHRDAADQVLICTGTGKKGATPRPPGYRPSRTTVFLMALHRIGGLVAELTALTDVEAESGSQQHRVLWPADTPCAVVERASCPDQKVIRTTLAHVAAAIEQEGSRPPGLLVVGRACNVLHGADFDPEQPWSVEEGFAGFGLDGIAAGLAAIA